MKCFLILFFISPLVLSFIISQPEVAQIHHHKESFGSQITTCQSSQINAIYLAISLCQNPTLLTTIQCVCKYMMDNFNQTWNAFAKPDDSLAAVSFWQFNNCSIVLNNYGKFSRQYKFWPVISYAQKEKLQIDGKTQQLTQLTHQNKIYGNCPQGKIQAVNNALKACDVASNQDAGDCIMQFLKNFLKQKWDAYTANRGLCALSANCFDGCGLFFSNYGSYNRTLNVWKAEPSSP